jgi:hypothetical protein
VQATPEVVKTGMPLKVAREDYSDKNPLPPYQAKQGPEFNNCFISDDFHYARHKTRRQLAEEIREI